MKREEEEKTTQLMASYNEAIMNDIYFLDIEWTVFFGFIIVCFVTGFIIKQKKFDWCYFPLSLRPQRPFDFSISSEVIQCSAQAYFMIYVYTILVVLFYAFLLQRIHIHHNVYLHT